MSEMVDRITAALREATGGVHMHYEGMVVAADALENQPWRDKGDREDGATHWRAMIDEALK